MANEGADHNALRHHNSCGCKGAVGGPQGNLPPVAPGGATTADRLGTVGAVLTLGMGLGEIVIGEAGGDFGQLEETCAREDSQGDRGGTEGGGGTVKYDAVMTGDKPEGQCGRGFHRSRRCSRCLWYQSSSS